MDSLDPVASEKFREALMRTPWGHLHQRPSVLSDGNAVLASAVQYDLTARLAGRDLQILGIGSLVSNPTSPGYARTLLEQLLQQAARSGAGMVLLFSPAGLEDAALNGFERIAGLDATLNVTESPRHGAPMTMVRGGEPRDLAAVVAMGRTRAEAFDFHLDRDVDFVQYAITRQRLRAGLRSPGFRQLQFFIAEEGTTAAAYVVMSVEGAVWTLEECGDRDASGARIGALLQALVAREPAERRPTIRGWLPHDLRPPQVTVVSEAPSSEFVMARMLDGTPAAWLRDSSTDVLYWHNDVF